MKHVLSAVAVLALAGCGSAIDTATRDTKPDRPPLLSDAITTITVAPTTVPAPPPTVAPVAAPPSDTDTYLTLVRDEYPVLASISDTDLIEPILAVCDSMDAGADPVAVLDVVLASGLDPGMAGFMIGAGVEALCPEWSAVLLNAGTS